MRGAAAGAVLCGGLLLLVAALGTRALPTADDYAQAVTLRRVGTSWAFVREKYTWWSGRVLCALTSSWCLRDPDTLGPVSAGLAVLFALSLTLAVRLADGFPRRAGHVPRPWPVVSDAVIIAAGILGFHDRLGENVFWVSCGLVTAFPTLVGLAWLYAASSHRGDRVTLPRLVPWFVFSVIAGNGYELMSPVLLVGGTYLLAAARRRRASRAEHTFFAAGLAGLAIGAVVLYAAPGNFMRAREFPGSFPRDPFALMSNYARILGAAAVAGWLPACWGAVAGLGCAGLAGVGPRGPQPRERLLRAAGIGLLVLVSLAPLAPVVDFVVVRVLYPSSLLMFAGAYEAAWGTAGLIGSTAPGRVRRNGQRAGQAVAIAVGCAAVVWLSIEVRQAAAYRQAALERDAVLRAAENAGRDMVVPARALPVPGSLYVDDLTHNPRHWVNLAVARWYGLGSVRLTPLAPPY